MQSVESPDKDIGIERVRGPRPSRSMGLTARPEWPVICGSGEVHDAYSERN